MSSEPDSAWQIVRLDEIPQTPWKNGGGVTRELLIWPAVSDSWQVRLSVAEVTSDGLFSRFERVERWFAVLRGAGVTLDIDGHSATLTATSAPLRFAGDSHTYCRLLNGPTQDFNLMLRGSLGTLSRRSGAAEPNLQGCALAAVYTAAKGAVLVCDGQTIHIPQDSLCWRSAPRQDSGWPETAVRVTGDDMLWLEIHR